MAEQHESTAEVVRAGETSPHLSHLAIEYLPHGVLVVRPNDTIAVVNREAERQLGYGHDELIGQPIDGLLPDLRGVGHSLGRARLRACHRDGSSFDVDVALKPLQTPEGTSIAVIFDRAAPPAQEAAETETIEERVRLEELVAELSVRFINLPADQVDGAIGVALQRIGEELDLDRCNFFRVSPSGILSNPARWFRPGCSPAPAPVNAATDFPWALGLLQSGRMVCFSSVDEIPSDVDRQGYRRNGVRSAVTIPLLVEGQVVGAVGFNVLREERHWQPQTLQRLIGIAAAFDSVLARQQSDEALQRALGEIRALRDQLRAENIYLRSEILQREGGGAVVGQSAAIQRVLAQVEQVAPTDSTVLLLGETGTGKELFASRIHESSRRRGKTMVRVNCAAIPATLIESELFGREKGAFTGALSQQVGRFELANHSTIFLDEIGDLPPEAQVKLLRVLEERQIERLGSPRSIPVDVRIIAATHRNLEQRIAEGTFREDLFYRLNVFPIAVPPLRERIEDIPLLVARFVDEFSKVFVKPIETVPRENMAALQRYAWPGNIRELRNIVERAMIVARGPRLTIELPSVAADPSKRSLRLMDVEREHIHSVLESSHWRIRGAGGAAERLGMRPTTLETRMAKLGLARPRP